MKFDLLFGYCYFWTDQKLLSHVKHWVWVALKACEPESSQSPNRVENKTSLRNSIPVFLDFDKAYINFNQKFDLKNYGFQAFPLKLFVNHKPLGVTYTSQAARCPPEPLLDPRGLQAAD